MLAICALIFFVLDVVITDGTDVQAWGVAALLILAFNTGRFMRVTTL